MVNTANPEFKETANQPLPNADLDTLKKLRKEAFASKGIGFKLQPQQRFLRRVLSPDAPTQSMLLSHGTGVGKTCTAIQIAEEFIMRPEFQGKRVLVLASETVQSNFQTEIFDASRVTVRQAGEDSILMSTQCTGRKYMDILQRTTNLSMQITTPEGREKVNRNAKRIIKEYYEFMGTVLQFPYYIYNMKLQHKYDFETWVHETFDNRLVIVDEAHSLRVSSQSKAKDKDKKLSYDALKTISQIATGMTLVLLTATPMYDSHTEVLDYFNLFLWNEKKQPATSLLKEGDFFKSDGSFKNPGVEKQFRDLCGNYISFIKGENPFTFPFRLPPPAEMIANPKDVTMTDKGKPIEQPRQFLTLVKNTVSPLQAEAMRTAKSVVEESDLNPYVNASSICALPGNKKTKEIFRVSDGKYKYKDGIPDFLGPSEIATYSAKFANVIKCINESTGVVFVYSNFVERGARLFAMCLERHGFKPFRGEPLMDMPPAEETSFKYALLTSDVKINDIVTSIATAKNLKNVDGKDIRVIIASPTVAEGVDFRFVRQIHVLDPWYNMSRIEQVLGRGMRTLSHSMLPFEQQNCTVYLHISRFQDKPEQEARDEYVYREFVEKKAVKIANVKKVIMESAMDCSLNYPVNSLPIDWMNLKVPQVRAQGNESVEFKLEDMLAPTFLEDSTFQCKQEDSQPDTDHVRPLSSMLDVKDEVFDKLVDLFIKKPVWKQDDIIENLKPYSPELIKYLLQNAVQSGFKIQDSNGRIGSLESRKGLIMFVYRPHETLADKLIIREKGDDVSIEAPAEEEEVEEEEEIEEEEEEGEKEAYTIRPKVESYKFSNALSSSFLESIPYEAKEWYYVDNAMTNDERIKHFLSLDWNGELPYYAQQIVVKIGDTPYVSLGPSNVYNGLTKKKVELIGNDLQEYKKWINVKLDKFIEDRKKIFSTFDYDKDGNGVFLIEMDEKQPDVIVRKLKEKTLGARNCMSFKQPHTNKLIQWLGEETPEFMKGKDKKGKPIEPSKDDLCMYLDLLTRKVFLEKKSDNFVWYPHYEWLLLSEAKASKSMRDRIKKLEKE